MTRRALILARGIGSRMRAPDAGVRLDAGQQRAADAGFKAMFPINGRPLLDYVLSELADAGVERAGLIVAPDHAPIRQYYDRESPPQRLQVEYIVQEAPRGTANAVLAGAAWTAGEPFLVLNGDNIYPADAVSALAAIDEPGLLAFDADELVRASNIPRERIAAFALLDVDAHGYLTHIVEKPQATSHAHPERRGSSLVSMNCWRFDERIFAPCRDVPLSARGEFELPEAVGLAITRGLRLRAVRASGAVLDLSRRADAPDLERRLAATVPRP